MEKRIRSRQGFEESNTVCPWCGHEHDVKVLDKIFIRSGNKVTMHFACDDCDMRVRLQRHLLGHYSFYKYIDYKKRRMIKAGRVPVERDGTINYA
jgi:transposase-like protein